ncbi:MAG: hypothetical protein K5989_03980 [Lachnospiraceae bacterium]|nr:hypothetical protein [Lachnospiraceae bacterium]
MLKAGGSHEFLGRFPYIINYHKLTREASLEIIRLIAQNAARNFDCELELGEKMIDMLLDSTESEYGCRLIDSELRNVVLRALKPALLEENPDRKLVIQIESADEMQWHWREITDADIEDCRIAALHYDYH